MPTGSLATEMMRESATSAAAIMHDDTVFWEELVEQDRQVALVTVKLQAGDYQNSEGAQVAIPAMPVFPISPKDPESQSEHRDKLVHRTGQRVGHHARTCMGCGRCA